MDCHIKLDTGMSRLGFLCDPAHFLQSMEQISEAVALPGLACTGIFTHFACSDEANEDSDRFTLEQFGCYQKGVAELEKRGIHFSLHHCCNSARYHVIPPNASGHGASRGDPIRSKPLARLCRADGFHPCDGFKIYRRHG